MYLSSDRLFTLDEQDNYFKKYLELGVKVQGHTTGFPCITQISRSGEGQTTILNYFALD